MKCTCLSEFIFALNINFNRGRGFQDFISAKTSARVLRCVKNNVFIQRMLNKIM